MMHISFDVTTITSTYCVALSIMYNDYIIIDIPR